MGWSRGDDVFNHVAQKLIDERVDGRTKRICLGALIEGLKHADWDTEDESLWEFRDDPVIVAVFAEHGITLDGDDDG